MPERDAPISSSSLPRGPWSSHKWPFAFAALLTTLATVVALLHTPFVRSAALSWAVARLQETAGVRVAAAGLEYNLVTLSATLRGVTAAVAGSETPFFEADAVSVELPWSIVRGFSGIQSLEVDRPRVVIIRQEDGKLNLPAPNAPADPRAPEPIGPVDIDTLIVRSLQLVYDDRVQDLSIDGRGVTLDLQRGGGALVEGELSMADGITVRAGDIETRISYLRGQLAFDGNALLVDELIMEAPEARLRVDGSVSLLAGEQRIDLQYAGSLEVERVAGWMTSEPPPTGTVAFSGGAVGPLDRPDVTIELTSDDLAWSGLQEVALVARAAIAGSTATLESFQAMVGPGEIAGEATIPLNENGEGRARVRWRDLDVGAIVDATAGDSPVRLAALGDGTAVLQWSGLDLLDAVGTVENRLRPPETPRGALALSGLAQLQLDGGGWQLSHSHRLRR